MSAATQKTPRFNMYSHLITALFTPSSHLPGSASTGAPGTAVDNMRDQSHTCNCYRWVHVVYMDAHRSPERPETRKHGHPTAQTRPRSLTEHAARDRGTHTQPHQHCDTNMRRSHCNGSGGGADDGAVGGLRVAPCLRTATTQMVSAAHVKLDAWTWA